ncbi:MAG: hypothetical protein ACR2L6_07030 [Gemmatimonadaceae bacterium]
MPTSRAKALIVLSAVALAKHLWFLITWIRASNRGRTQEESVEIFLSQFPHSMLGLDAIALTWVLIVVGMIGAVLAFVARRTSGRWRPVATALLSMHVVFVLWYLFTLM